MDSDFYNDLVKAIGLCNRAPRAAGYALIAQHNDFDAFNGSI